MESKERDELHAIAQALSVKTTTRTKKADIIDGNYHIHWLEQFLAKGGMEP